MPRSKVRPGTVLAKVAVAPAPERKSSAEGSPVPAPVAASPAPAPAPAEAGSRLELTPLELGPGPATGSVLQGATSDMASAADPGAGTGAGAQDAATEGAPLDAAAAEAQRLAALEGELNQMRSEQERLRLALETMNTQLTEARNQTTSNAVVYGLAVLVLLLLGVLVWLLRSRSAALNAAGLGAGVGTGFGATRLPSLLDHPGSGSGSGGTSGDGTAASGSSTPTGAAPWWADSTHAPAKASGFSAVELDDHVPGSEDVTDRVDRGDSEPAANSAASRAGAEAQDGFPHSQIDRNSLPLETQDLADLVRQVEFFEVLGQDDEARSALEAFIKNHPAQSELPYLMLMQLAIRQNDGTLPDLQRQYMRHYDQPAPQPQDCAAEAPGLLEDPIWVTRLQQVWPAAEAGSALQAALTAQPEQSLLRRRTLPALLDAITLFEVWTALQEDVSGVVPAAATLAPTVPTAPAATTSPPAAVPFQDSQSLPVPESEFPAIDIDLSAYSLPEGASGAIRKSGSAASNTPGTADAASAGDKPATDNDLPPLDFDMGDFPEVPDADKKP